MKRIITINENELYSLVKSAVNMIVEGYNVNLNRYGKTLINSINGLGWKADDYVERFKGPIDVIELNLHNVENLCDLDMMRQQMYYDYTNNYGISFDIDEPESDDCDGILTIYC